MVTAYYPGLDEHLDFAEGILASLCHPKGVVKTVSFDETVVASPFLGGEKYGPSVKIKKGEEMNIRHGSGTFGVFWKVVRSRGSERVPETPERGSRRKKIDMPRR